ncbi:MAG TPA: hypothetical protein VFA59_02530 [Vicinamibacterales bacterium]|nr:hypothetical protein [Vicinamibacterales bacterium]
MREQFRPITINFAHVNVVGVPGLMLVFIAWAIAVEFPEARWIVLLGVAGGAVVASILVMRRRAARDRDGGSAQNKVLRIGEPASADAPAPRRSDVSSSRGRVTLAAPLSTSAFSRP